MTCARYWALLCAIGTRTHPSARDVTVSATEVANFGARRLPLWLPTRAYAISSVSQLTSWIWASSIRRSFARSSAR
jgi:hypothetical protein